MFIQRSLLLLALIGMFGLSLGPSWLVNVGQAKDQFTNSGAMKFAKDVLSAIKIISEDHVKPATQAELVRWSVEGIFKAAKQPLPAPISKTLADLQSAQQKELLHVLYDSRASLGNNNDLAYPGDLDIALQAIFDKMEPGFKHPSQKTKWPALNIGGPAGSPAGVDLTLQVDSMTGWMKVVTPVFGSPAYKAGIRADDLITRMEDLSELDTDGTGKILAAKGLIVADFEKELRGSLGTKVRLSVLKPGEKNLRIVELSRQFVDSETVLGIKRNNDDSWDYFLDPQTKIGYVRLTLFSGSAFGVLKKVLHELNRAGIKGLILDLRFNPGGLVDSAVKISDLFLDEGMIVTFKKRNGPLTSYFSKREDSFLKLPMVCLINDHSASASEIVAACLQDRARAVIVGQRSAGKAEIRTSREFSGGFLNMTTVVFDRPSGKGLSKIMAADKDNWGVHPDPGFALPLPAREQKQLTEYLEDKMILRHPKAQPKGLAFHDRQLEMAVDYLSK